MYIESRLLSGKLEASYFESVRDEGVRIMEETEHLAGEERNERIYELTSELEIIGTFRAKLILAVTDQSALEMAVDMGLELTNPCFFETLASYCFAADVREYITRQGAWNA